MLNVRQTITIATIAFFLLTFLGGGCKYMNTQSEWNRKNNAVTAAFDRQRAAHDEMWKVIKGQMSLKDDQKQMFTAVLEAYQNRGQAYKGAQWVWIQENFPNLFGSGAPQMYQKLANTISDQNSKFTSVRNDVILTTTEYNNFVTNAWNQFFLFGEQEKVKNSKIITSSVTNEAANTLEDNLEWQKQ